MINHIQLFVISLLYAFTNGFSLTEVQPQKISVQEGESIVLNCAVDSYYEWCTFKHNGKKCDYEWRRDVYNVTELDCKDYYGRAEYKGDYNNYKCGIELKFVTLEDQGEWSCEIEEYNAGRTRGYGYNVTGKFFIEVIPKPKPTTTTSATSRISTFAKTTEDVSVPLATLEIMNSLIAGILLVIIFILFIVIYMIWRKKRSDVLFQVLPQHSPDVSMWQHSNSKKSKITREEELKTIESK